MKSKMLFSRITFGKLLYLIIVLVCSHQFVNAQYKKNYGIGKPQAKETLPKSAQSAPVVTRKEKVPQITTLEPSGFNTFNLMDGWELYPANKVEETGLLISKTHFSTSDWYNATVPGTVLTTLVDQGIYPDPYFGVNNLYIPDSLCRQQWWYRIEFKIPKDQASKQKWIIFDGINYKADIWLNQHLVGSVDGAFKRGKINVTDRINDSGTNVLAVKIFPPPHPDIPHEQSPSAGIGPNGGLLCLDGPTFISSQGWDWIPGMRDRDIGIWQNVRLKFTKAVELIDPQVITDLPLPDTSKTAITVKATLHNVTDAPQKVTLAGEIEDIGFQQAVELLPGERREVIFSPDEFDQLNIDEPRLWWPNGYGHPELYDLILSVNQGNTISDRQEVRFGVRELTYEMTVKYPDEREQRVKFSPTNEWDYGKPLFDNKKRKEVSHGTTIPALRDGADQSLLQELPESEMGPYLVIRVNGKRIFCRGGNWGMDDGMKRVSRARLEPYFKLHKEENFNMIRNWTGESTEEIFYTLADEYGMLVWNDFWMSTEGSNIPPQNEHLFLENARDVVKRFRNHPSIAIWCPRNEGYAPVTMEDQLAAMIAKEDGTRHYHGNSRYLNMVPSGPWRYFKDSREYYTHIANGFNSEMGTPSVPTAASMRKMMVNDDLWPISDVWYYHDLHHGTDDYLKAIDSLYGEAKDLEDFCKKAQMINYASHRAMFESWNSKMWNNTSGLLLWMSHPAWPSTLWQTYSWDYETFGSFYGCKKACEPIHIQMNLHDKKVIALNTTLKDRENVLATMSLISLDGKGIYNKEKKIDIPADQKVECFVAAFDIELPEVYLIRLSLLDDQDNMLSQNDYWQSGNDFKAFNRLSDAELSVSDITSSKKNDGSTEIVFDVKNNSQVPAIALKVNLRNKQTQEIELPVYASSGYFNLMPGEERQLSLNFSRDENKDYSMSISGYNLDKQNSLFDLEP